MKEIRRCCIGILAAAVCMAGCLVLADEPAASGAAALYTTAEPVEVEEQTGFVVVIDGVPVDLSGAAPYVTGKTLMLPVRMLAEALGYTVIWDEGETPETSAVQFGNEEIWMRFRLQDNVVVRTVGRASDSERLIALPVAPVLRGELTYVPAEIFQTFLGDGNFSIDGQTVYMQSPASGTIEETVQTPNPWKEYETTAAVSAALGYTVEAPECLLTNYQLSAIRAMEAEKMLELVYQIPEMDMDYELYVRIQPTEALEDISGDYTQYAFSDTMEMDGNTVYVRGENGTNIAIWYVDGFSFAIIARDSLGRGLNDSQRDAVYEAAQKMLLF